MVLYEEEQVADCSMLPLVCFLYASPLSCVFEGKLAIEMVEALDGQPLTASLTTWH
jgi:hypothetical protein